MKAFFASIILLLGVACIYAGYEYEGYLKISDLQKAGPDALKISGPFIPSKSALLVNGIAFALGHPNYSNFDPKYPLTLFFFHDPDTHKSALAISGKWNTLEMLLPSLSFLGFVHEKIGELDVVAPAASNILNGGNNEHKTKITSIGMVPDAKSFKGELLFTYKHWDPVLAPFSALSWSGQKSDTTVGAELEYQPQGTVAVDELMDSFKAIEGVQLTKTQPAKVSIQVDETKLPNVKTWWTERKNSLRNEL